MFEKKIGKEKIIMQFKKGKQIYMGGGYNKDIYLSCSYPSHTVLEATTLFIYSSVCLKKINETKKKFKD